MGSPTQLTLECRSSASSCSSVLKAISTVSNSFDRVKRLDEYLKGLEDERKKIEGFKRELPFCMHLLNEAIAASKEVLADLQAPLQDSSVYGFPLEERSTRKPVLEEFLPIKKSAGESSDGSYEMYRPVSKKTKFDNGQEPNWMSTVQLWSQPEECKPMKRQEETCVNRHEEDNTHLRKEVKLFSDSKQRSGGAFVPFSRERQTNPTTDIGKCLPDLALSSAEPEHEEELKSNNENSAMSNGSRSRSPGPTRSTESAEMRNPNPTHASVSSKALSSQTQPANGQTQRKARRCWSPELHRRFVNALQQLGGSQVATPKQIRELMKVDGLTNDEVKSHLQKYRLHTRRPSPTAHAQIQAAPQAPHLVVLGGIWVPPGYTAGAHQSPGLHNTQPRLCQLATNQDTSYEQKKKHSQSLCSPQGPLQLTGQSSCARGTSADGGREESVGEDGRSEGSSWKIEEVSTNGDTRNARRSLSLRKNCLQTLQEGDI